MSLSQQPVESDPLNFTPDMLKDEQAGRIRKLLDSVREHRTTEQRREALDELIKLHAEIMEEDEDSESARQAEIAFLLLLRDDPEILDDQEYRNFVVNCLEQKSFYKIEWESGDEVIMVAEVLYGFRYRDEVDPDELTRDVRDLMRHALRQFEREDRSEEMFGLMQRAPLPPSMMDAELVRLRNRLHLYEVRRVQWKRRYLYVFLAIEAFLVFLGFPLLFQYAENGLILREVEEATGLEIVEGRIQCRQTSEDADCEPERQFFSFADSVYWSVITFGAVGYGDVRSVTILGKLLAGIHGVLGVLTTGIIAGLILNWLTPRSLRV